MKCFVCKKEMTDRDHPFNIWRVGMYVALDPDGVYFCEDCFKDNAPRDVVAALSIEKINKETISLAEFWSLKVIPPHIHNIYCEKCKTNLIDAYNDYYGKQGVMRETLEYLHSRTPKSGTQFVCYKCHHDNRVCYYD